MGMLSREIFFAGWFLLIAWTGLFPPFLNFIFGIGFFYFLFRYIIVLLIENQISSFEKKFLLTQYNILLLVHSFIFLLLLIYIDFDFFASLGDWFEYDKNGRFYASTLKGETTYDYYLTGTDDLETKRGILSGRFYSMFIGLIYYFFDYSVNLAVAVNILFMVSSFIILYLIVHPIFGHPAAKNAMYISAFFPLFFFWEINLWKECFLSFSFLGACLMAYRITHKWTWFNFIILSIFILFVFNLRFWVLFPIFIYILTFFLFFNFKKFIYISIIIGSFGFIIFKGLGEGNSPTLSTLIFQTGYSITNAESSINYQINLFQISSLINILTNHMGYYIMNIPKVVISPWIDPQIYNIPFLSPILIMNEKQWVFQVLVYFSGVFLWLNFLIAFSGAKEMFRYKKSTLLMLLIIILIPFIVSLTPVNPRYMDITKFFIIICIAIGLEQKNNIKVKLFCSYGISLILIVLANIKTYIMPAFIIPLSAVILYYFFRIIFNHIKERKNKEEFGMVVSSG